jgi:UDPglucose 6-dehydrogenase
MNDIANLCELVGADIQDVARGMSFDERIGGKFLNAGIGLVVHVFPRIPRHLNILPDRMVMSLGPSKLPLT